MLLLHSTNGTNPVLTFLDDQEFSLRCRCEKLRSALIYSISRDRNYNPQFIDEKTEALFG